MIKARLRAWLIDLVREAIMLERGEQRLAEHRATRSAEAAAEDDTSRDIHRRTLNNQYDAGVQAGQVGAQVGKGSWPSTKPRFRNASAARRRAEAEEA